MLYTPLIWKYSFSTEWISTVRWILHLYINGVRIINMLILSPYKVSLSLNKCPINKYTEINYKWNIKSIFHTECEYNVKEKQLVIGKVKKINSTLMCYRGLANFKQVYTCFWHMVWTAAYLLMNRILAYIDSMKKQCNS